MKFYTSDIEANNWIEFLIIGLYDGVEYKVFNSIETYINYILINCKNSRIYFHNGGRYDFLFLLEPLLDSGYDLNFINSGSGFISIKLKDYNIEFADSYKLLPTSLEKLIETFNIEHKKIEIDFSKKHKYNEKKLNDHLINDCKALYEILWKVYKEDCMLRLTIASQSLKLFETKFFNGAIYNLTDKQDLHFRNNFYRGGRVEVYRTYGTNLYYYDINSLYPYVMLNKMPIYPPIKTFRYKKDKIGFYKIKLKQDTDYFISPLIYKDKIGSTYYVNGNKGDEFNVSSAELDLLNVKYEIINGIYFDSGDYIFNDYIEHYYNIKVNAKNETERYLAKLKLNSLYGKFGQKLNGETLIRGYMEGSKVYDASNDLFLIDEKRNIKFKGVHIAAYITSLARTELMKKIYEIGEDHIYYCDTDSIFTDKPIETGKGIGEWKLEDKVLEAIFISPKVYGYFNEQCVKIVKYKGFKKDSFSYDDIRQLYFNNKPLVTNEKRMLSFKESVRRKNGIIKSEGKFLKLVDDNKLLSFNYTKRKVENTTNITQPYRLRELINK